MCFGAARRRPAGGASTSSSPSLASSISLAYVACLYLASRSYTQTLTVASANKLINAIAQRLDVPRQPRALLSQLPQSLQLRLLGGQTRRCARRRWRTAAGAERLRRRGRVERAACGVERRGP
jgi:hypothetical protein